MRILIFASILTFGVTAAPAGNDAGVEEVKSRVSRQAPYYLQPRIPSYGGSRGAYGPPPYSPPYSPPYPPAYPVPAYAPAQPAHPVYPSTHTDINLDVLVKPQRDYGYGPIAPTTATLLQHFAPAPPPKKKLIPVPVPAGASHGGHGHYHG